MSDTQHLATNLVVRLTNQASLAVVEITMFGLTFFVSTFAFIYRGRQLSYGSLFAAFPRGIKATPGFFWLSVLCIIEIVGAAMYVNQEVNQHLTWPDNYAGDPLLNKPDPTAKNAYAITLFITSAPLLLAAFSFAQFNNGGSGRIIMLMLQSLPIIGFALGVAGGVEYGQNSSQAMGQQLLEASAIIFLISLAALVCLMAVNLTYARTLRTMAIVASTPFLIIRIIYNILVAFAPNDSQYAFSLPDLSVQIFMRLLMQFIVILFWLFTGLGDLSPEGNSAENSEESDGSFALKERNSTGKTSPRLTPPPQTHHSNMI